MIREGDPVTIGDRIGICVAVFRWTAVVQYPGEQERDVEWLDKLKACES